MSIWNRNPALIPLSLCANNRFEEVKKPPLNSVQPYKKKKIKKKKKKKKKKKRTRLPLGRKQLLWAVRWKEGKAEKGRGEAGLSKGRANSYLSSCFNCIWPKLQIYLLTTKADWLVPSLRTQIWETTSPHSLQKRMGIPAALCSDAWKSCFTFGREGRSPT